MFPIPWNKEYRKKDGTLVKISDAISGGGGGSDLPPHSSTDAGKVLTVGEDGNLEWDTRGSGGGDAFLTLDFTKYGTRTINGVQYSENGALFSGTSNYIILTSFSTAIKDFTLYLDIGAFLLQADPNLHRRFIAVGESSGLIYRYQTNKWAFYGGSWEDSSIEDPAFFSNSKLKIYVDQNDKWHIYKDDILVFEPTEAYRVVNSFTIGSGSQSINTGLFKSARLYNGNYTE